MFCSLANLEIPAKCLQSCNLELLEVAILEFQTAS